jgi:type II secretory pathway pseudopilin PulG
MRSCERILNQQRGMTLIEALIACSLLLIALVLTGVLFRYGTRTTKASEERNDVMTQRTVLSERLRRALGNSHRTGNTYFYLTASDPNPDLAICLITTETVEGQKGWNAETQRPIYQGYRLFYRDSRDDTLRYIYHPIPPTESGQPLEESEVRNVIATGTSQVLARETSEFCLYSLQDGSVTLTEANPLGLRWRTGLTRGNSLLTEESFKLVNL